MKVKPKALSLVNEDIQAFTVTRGAITNFLQGSYYNIPIKYSKFRS